MKKLNITKKYFSESKYFTSKYGNLKYKAESGNIYKTDKGHVIQFNEADAPDFGAETIDKAQPTGDVNKDFDIAMSVLRDDNYEAFISDLNKLATDPKVAALRDAIVEKFNSPDGIDVSFSGNTSVAIKNIHPTQFEVDMEKSLKFPMQKKPEGMKQAFSNEAVLINNTPLVVAEVGGVMYIIDGHHRWSQIYCLNPNAKMVVRIIKSDKLFKNADDVLKLVQMQLFIAKDGGKLPQATVDSQYNLYTIDEGAFKQWVTKTMTQEACTILTGLIQQTFGGFDKVLTEALNDNQDNVAKCASYLWKNVETMRQEAQPTKNAHGRGDMPQTDQVDGEYMEPKAAPLHESKKLKITKKQYQESKFFQARYGTLKFMSENGKFYKTSKGKVIQFNESDAVDEDLRGRAMEAAKLLGVVAFVGDAELDAKQKLYRKMKNVKAAQMADAIDVIKEYRAAAKNLDEENPSGSFRGITD